MLFFIAATAGAISGSLYDPVFWLCLLCAAATAFVRELPLRFLALALVVAGGCVLRASLAGGSPFLPYFIAGTAISMLIVFGVARLVRKLAPRQDA